MVRPRVLRTAVVDAFLQRAGRAVPRVRSWQGVVDALLMRRIYFWKPQQALNPLKGGWCPVWRGGVGGDGMME